LGGAARLLSLVGLAALVCSIAALGAGTRSAASPTLVVDNSFALDSADPHHAFDPTSSIVDRAVYDTLFTYRRNDLAHPVPLLVRSWSREDAKTLRVRLRRDVHFADGTPLTSADVVFSLRRLVNLKGNPSFLLAGVTVSATDAYTVVIRSSTPQPQLLSILANTSTGIVNSKLVREHGGTDAANASKVDRAERWLNSPASAGAGSGPYVLQAYAPTSEVALRPNPNYWGARKPAFGAVVIRNMAAPAQLLNIRRGAHQIALDLSSAQAQTLDDDAGLVVKREPSPWVFYMFTSNDRKLSQVTPNKRFQQSLRHALDYRALVSIAGPGAVQAPGLIPSVFLGALPPREAIKRDVRQARAELSASGLAARQVTLEYPSDLTINGVSFATLAQKVQANLEENGFNVALAGSPVTTLQPRVRAGHVAFGLWAWLPNYADPSDSLIFTPGNLIALRVDWPAGSDPAIEKLAAKAPRATAPATRARIYRELQLKLNARGPFIPLIQPTQTLVATSDLTGAVFNGIYGVDLTQVFPR
jgi:peptide/nickel transport system substrate-binding protein